MSSSEEEVVKLKITPEFYSKFTPQEIVNVYMEYWGKVRILPEDVDAKAILRGGRQL